VEVGGFTLDEDGMKNPDIGLEQGIADQFARSAARVAEEPPFRSLGDAGPPACTPRDSGPDCGGSPCVCRPLLYRHHTEGRIGSVHVQGAPPPRFAMS
jgi:hypothetical protein